MRVMISAAYFFIFLNFSQQTFAAQCAMSCGAGQICVMMKSSNPLLGTEREIPTCVSDPNAQANQNPILEQQFNNLRVCQESCTSVGGICQKDAGIYYCVNEVSTSGLCPQIESLLASCRQSEAKVIEECNEETDSGMTNASAQIAQLGAMAHQSGDINAACTKMNTIMGVANAALFAFNMSCSSAVAECSSSCAMAKQKIAKECPGVPGTVPNTVHADNIIGNCVRFQSKADAAKMGMQNMMSSAGQASRCSNMTNGTGMPTPQICAANPSAPGCAQLQNTDCTNPQVAMTNKICICAKTPGDPQCLSAQNAGSKINNISGSVDSSSRLNTGSADVGDIPGLPELAQGEFKGGDGGGPVEGQQGGGSPVGGGGGLGGGSPGAGGGDGGGKSDSPQVVGGFYGGTGGNNGSGGSYGDGGGSRSYGGGSSGGPGSPGGPDLSKFLPGQKFDPRRGISGVSGPDGITGPNSDIWLKVKNRYQVMETTLLP